MGPGHVGHGLVPELALHSMPRALGSRKLIPGVNLGTKDSPMKLSPSRMKNLAKEESPGGLGRTS